MKRLEAAWDAWWFAPACLVRAAMFRIALFSVASLAVLEVYGIAATGARLAAAKEPSGWNPLLLVELWWSSPPSEAFIAGWFGAAIGLGAAAAFGLWTRWTTALAAPALVLALALAYSFGQAHHARIALAFGLCFIPFTPSGRVLSLDALLARWRGQERPTSTHAPQAGLAVRATMVAVALGYAFAGGSKIVLAGADWINGATLQAIMMGNEARLSKTMASLGHLLAPLSALTLLGQIAFPLALVWRRAGYALVALMTGFHLIAWWTMNTGTYHTLWITAIAAFCPLERFAAFIRRLLVPRWGGLSLLLGLILIALPAAFVFLYTELLPVHWRFLVRAAFALWIWTMLPWPAIVLRVRPSGGMARVAQALAGLDPAGRIQVVEDPHAAGRGAIVRGLLIAPHALVFWPILAVDALMQRLHRRRKSRPA